MSQQACHSQPLFAAMAAAGASLQACRSKHAIANSQGQLFQQGKATRLLHTSFAASWHFSF
jgi:hypothetical protein